MFHNYSSCKNNNLKSTTRKKVNFQFFSFFLLSGGCGGTVLPIRNFLNIFLIGLVPQSWSLAFCSCLSRIILKTLLAKVFGTFIQLYLVFLEKLSVPIPDLSALQVLYMKTLVLALTERVKRSLALRMKRMMLFHQSGCATDSEG